MNVDRIHHSFQIGLFGGTFNPIHNGHLKAALDVLAQFALHRIYFIPSALPPHKTRGTLATAQDRFEMVRMAIADHPRLNASEVELQRPGPSYTIDTLLHFKSELSADSRLHFIVGIDAFLEINSWKDHERLLEQAAFIVMTRPGEATGADSFENIVSAYTLEHLAAAYTLTSQGNALVHPHFQPIYLARVEPIDIAATHIRQLVREGRDISQWVCPAVADYIEEKGLYR